MENKQLNAVLIGMSIILALVILIVGFRVLKMNRLAQVQPDVPAAEVEEPLAEGEVLEEEHEETASGEQDRLHTAFVEFHLEVASFPAIRSNWSNLRAAIELADTYDFKYSLMFTPQWAQVVLQTDGLLEELREWEANGHEIGVHHHLTDHLHWDGYSNESHAHELDEYRGTVEEMMDLIGQLPADGIIYTGAISQADEDYPDALPYNTINEVKEAGGEPSSEDMVSVPEARKIGDQIVLELGKMGYAIGHLQEQLTIEDIIEAVEESGPEEILGIVLNDDTIENQFDRIEELIQTLDQLRVEVRTVKDILDNYDFAQ